MSQKVKAILFDLDGTLLDTAQDFSFVLNEMLASHGEPAKSFAEIRQTVSDGARAMVALGFGLDQNAPALEPLRLEFLDRYDTHLAVETTLFPGMAETLKYIEAQAWQWGLVTNKLASYTHKILSTLQLQQRCATVICPDHVTHTKPHPEPLYLACEQLGCSVDEAIYIGDHRRDIEAGRNAGMRTIAAAYGYIHAGDSVTHWGADYNVATVAELLSLLQQIQQEG